MQQHLPAAVEITEVGPRDGFQSLTQLIPTQQKVDFINRLIAAGVPRIEVASFVSPHALPQMADAADVIAQLHRDKSSLLVALVPNQHGALNAVAAGVDQLAVFVSASETHNQKNVNRPIAASLQELAAVADIALAHKIPLYGIISTAFGCPFEGPVAAAQVAKIAAAYQALGAAGIALGDTTGMATPPLVSAVVNAVRAAAPRLTLGLHFHNTRGIGLVNVITGLSLGIVHYDSAFGGIGGCPFAPSASGNICTEDLAYLLHELGIRTGIDLRQLIAIARDVETTVGHPLPGQVMKAGLRLDLHPVQAVPSASG